ncbi:hypothetical protein YC2023_043550 [Brassica napus]
MEEGCTYIYLSRMLSHASLIIIDFLKFMSLRSLKMKQPSILALCSRKTSRFYQRPQKNYFKSGVTISEAQEVLKVNKISLLNNIIGAHVEETTVKHDVKRLSRKAVLVHSEIIAE